MDAVAGSTVARLGVRRVKFAVESDWEKVYSTHARRLTRLAVLLVGESDAHDLVADAVWRAVHSGHWRRASSPGAYLTASLVNLANDRRRQNARRLRREQRAAVVAPTVVPPANVEHRLVVRRALAQLSPAQVAVVYLHYWEDMTLEAVATQLGLGVGTVRSHLDRAKRRLRPLFTADFESEHHHVD